MDKMAKRRTDDEAFQAEAQPPARESRSTQAAARALHSAPQRRYPWPRQAPAPRPPRWGRPAAGRPLRADWRKR